ncbi:hypothetical protein [Zhihengliuella halotolerans]|nr:hypothetical protein [Zhihengliuella halotolerans]
MNTETSSDRRAIRYAAYLVKAKEHDKQRREIQSKSRRTTEE